MKKIRVALYGYGNLSRGVETSMQYNEDMELCAVFSRREVKPLSGVASYHVDEAIAKAKDIDVLIMCGGSMSDLPVQSPLLAEHFNIVDSFDTHARIPEHFKNVDAAAKKSGHVGVISVGWDPGMFSVMRLYGESVLPNGKSYTFWGRGVSQGHSDAVRRVEGVVDARQYTVPVDSALKSVRNGEHKEFTARQMHKRECYVVAAEGADKEKIREQIVTMPNYFSDYDTTVNFITLEELKRDHAGIPHGGNLIRSGETSCGTKHVVEYSLKLDSNPEFTSGVMIAFARAAYRLYEKGDFGCKTIFDIPPVMLSKASHEELISHLL